MCPRPVTFLSPLYPIDMTGQPNTISNQIPDYELVRKIINGDKQLFEMIIRRYNQRLYRIGMSILCDESAAEEAMQAAYISAYEHRALQNAITELPEKYRLVFVLREIEDLSVRETAAIAGIQTTNVQVRLRRAKAMLRENLNNKMKDSIYPFHLTRCDKIVNHVMSRLNTPP